MRGGIDERESSREQPQIIENRRRDHCGASERCRAERSRSSRSGARGPNHSYGLRCSPLASVLKTAIDCDTTYPLDLMKYNIDYYLPKAVLARRAGLVPPRPPKTEAEMADDDERFSYDANRGWSHKHQNRRRLTG